MGTRLACRRVSAGRWGPEPSVAPATVVLPWMISGTRAPLHQGSSSLDGRLPAWCSPPIPLLAHEQDFTGHHNTEPLRVVFLLVAQPLHCRQVIALNITDSANKAIGNSRKNPKKCERAIVLFSVEIARQSRISSRSAWPQPPPHDTDNGIHVAVKTKRTKRSHDNKAQEMQ